MDICKTIKVKPWGEGQGDYVEINAEDFDPAVHTALDDAGIAANVEQPQPEPVSEVEADLEDSGRGRKAKDA